MSHELLFPALSTMLALLIYFSQSIFVSMARSKYKIDAPKTHGNADFERVFRVHYNTLEALPLFIVSLWFFAFLVSPLYAGILGLVWCLGRLGYMYGYYKSADKRHSYGSLLTYVALVSLVFGSLYYIVTGLIFGM
jgi:glutathione S-transferase